MYSTEVGPEEGIVCKLHLYRGREQYLPLQTDIMDRINIGAEINAHTYEALDTQLQATEGMPLRTIHLRADPGEPFMYNFNTPDQQVARDSAYRISELLDTYGDKARGFILHEERGGEGRMTEAEKKNYAAALSKIDGKGTIFLEYCSSDPDDWIDVVSRVTSDSVSACVDIGHLYQHFRAQEGLDRDAAVERSREVVERVSNIGKPVHFHVHDCDMTQGHPWYGVPDHLPLGDGELGLEGIKDIIEPAYRNLSADKVTYNLEILLRPEYSQPLSKEEADDMERYAAESGNDRKEIMKDAQMIKGTYESIATEVGEFREILDELSGKSE